ncbi:protein kinase [Gemmatimonas sp.]|uniref:protein kinase domain-containing protein n=1 Tax=Gemmatimonas sp. TaxID=1962908 RepID=UPI00286E8E44|nr:protein kinase [Gemmatimonas sp.]
MNTADTLARLSAALADRYRVDRELGQGGMATVYLAHDIKHDRDVAIKVLHPDLGAALGGDRFLSEIRTTARLQHPHILPLLDSGDADGLLYYVMPLVTGETLRSRLERERQLPINDAVRIAREVASALDYAHRQGVIHRDIKPENILLHDGSALVADFGIALAVQSAAGQRMTQTGLSLGTPQYMSPEQAMGERTIDARSDIYALGAMTYEMLAGDAPFTGSSVQAIVAKVLSEKPTSLRTLRDTVPHHVEQAVFTALAKLPADRFESAKSFADALLTTGGQPPAGGAADRAPATRAAGSTGWKAVAAVLAVIAVGASGFAAWTLSRASAEVRDVGLPPTSPLRMEDTYRNFAVAHDGTFLVYEAKIGESSQLWYRSLAGNDAHVIVDTDGALGTPRIAPDDQSVAFLSGGTMKVVNLASGQVTAAGSATDPHGGSWLANGRVFFSSDDGRTLRFLDPGTGSTRTVPMSYCVMPELLNESEVLCGGGANKFATVVGLSPPNPKRFIRRAGTAAGPSLLLGADFRIVDDQYVVYMGLDGSISATKFTNRDSLIVGRSVSLVAQVRRTAYTGGGQFDLARNGALVYVPGVNAEVGRVVRRPLGRSAAPFAMDPAAFLRFTPSPDGQRMAAVVQGVQSQELRLYDLRKGTHETLDQALYLSSASWSPDGRRLVYRKYDFDDPDTESLMLRRVDSPEAPRVLLTSKIPIGMVPSSYLDDKFLLIGVGMTGGTGMIIDPTTDPARVDTLSLLSNFVSISPDRKWIAYTPQGATGVSVQPWPAMDRKYTVDLMGREPLWHGANELVYFSYVDDKGVPSQTFNRVRVDGPADSPVGSREVLFTDPRFVDTPGWSHALMPGGDVVYLQATAENLGYYVRVIPGWVATMKRAVDAANK